LWLKVFALFLIACSNILVAFILKCFCNEKYIGAFSWVLTYIMYFSPFQIVMLFLLGIISDIVAYKKKYAMMLCSILNLGHIYGKLQNGK
jgi:hypothetical protein